MRFWRDKRIHNEQLKYVAPRIYEISRKKDGLVKDSYRRSYRLGPLSSGDLRLFEERNKLLRRLENAVPYPNQRDQPQWL